MIHLTPARREAFAFGLRSWLACVLALYLAFLLQIDEPLWAALTVWQVIQPAPGMAISKGFYRMVGVVIGALMGIVLIALFSQTPELFIVALALWVGACTVAASLLTRFRGFAGVSAGFMTALVGLGAYHAPEKVFDIAMARGAATLIGIACSLLVTTLFAPRRAQAALIQSLRQAISDTARRAAFPLEGALADRFALGPSLAGSLVGLEPVIEFAAQESARGRQSAGPARRLVADLFAVLTAKRALEEYLGRVGLGRDAGSIALYREGMALLDQVPAMMAAGKEAELLEKTRAYHRRVREAARATSSPRIDDRLADLAAHLERALTLCLALQDESRSAPPSDRAFRLHFHRDRQAAAINGARSFLAVLLAGAFWIGSQWSAGPFLIIPIVMVCSIFVSAPYPEAAALNFMKGAACGIGAAYLCTYHFLAGTGDFALFAASEALFLIPAAMIQLNPRRTAFGLAYGIFFFLVGEPSNAMTFNPAAFFNSALAILTGALVATLAFRLFMPPDPRRARRHVVSRMRSGLKEMAEQEPIPAHSEWQTRNFDRVYRLCDPANPSAIRGSQAREWYEGGLATVHAGNEVLRLRHLLREGALPERAATLGRSLLRAVADIAAEPEAVSPAIRRTTAALAAMTPPTENPGAWDRLLAVADELEAFFAAHSRFLNPERKPMNERIYGT
ncbi:Uncharacterized membrane protein YccC [Verrucomicrobium sp. GAS474]|uniref:FUSC family protein n=1 Tax=Verrucomicrobium sp. GAS474 TaxID=1882831 RepID=UPI0008796EA9|nr:FUSC family protein [Verrucomicrobium sp. GAS474]SDT97124.1 Uncharacterized membrane protein YccC [Verrucomicrobium sp. GAS474]